MLLPRFDILTVLAFVLIVPSSGLAQNNTRFAEIPQEFKGNQDKTIKFLRQVDRGCFIYEIEKSTVTFCVEDGKLNGAFSEYNSAGELILDGQFCDVELDSIVQIITDSLIRCGSWIIYKPISVQKEYSWDKDLPYQLNYYHLNGMLRRQCNFDTDSLELITEWTENGSLEYLSVYGEKFKAPHIRIDIGNNLSTSIDMERPSKFYTNSDSTETLIMKIESFDRNKSIMIGDKKIIKW